MTWFEFAEQHRIFLELATCAVLGIILYAMDTVRRVLLGHYNLKTAATRTRQEAYLIKQICPLLETQQTLSLSDPVHRMALARAVANHLVKDEEE
ncbi:hypothetical protein KBA39_05650 [Myxococcota bacterium]|nr:hypothetical protein [Myxococcota bacterium]